MEVFFVIISGVAVFIIGEIFVRFFLAPIHKLKEIKGEIASTLLFYANNYGNEYRNLEAAFNDAEEIEEIVIKERIESLKRWNNDLMKASDETRLIAGRLISAAEGIPFYAIVSRTKVIPAKKDILSARKNLIALSNSFPGSRAVESSERSESVCKLLNIEFMNE